MWWVEWDVAVKRADPFIKSRATVWGDGFEDLERDYRASVLRTLEGVRTLQEHSPMGEVTSWIVPMQGDRHGFVTSHEDRWTVVFRVLRNVLPPSSVLPPGVEPDDFEGSVFWDYVRRFDEPGRLELQFFGGPGPRR